MGQLCTSWQHIWAIIVNICCTEYDTYPYNAVVHHIHIHIDHILCHNIVDFTRFWSVFGRFLSKIMTKAHIWSDLPVFCIIGGPLEGPWEGPPRDLCTNRLPTAGLLARTLGGPPGTPQGVPTRFWDPKITILPFGRFAHFLFLTEACVCRIMAKNDQNLVWDQKPWFLGSFWTPLGPNLTRDPKGTLR